MLVLRLVLFVLASNASLALAKNSNLTACLERVQSGTLGLSPDSYLDSKGRPTTPNVTAAIPYGVCVAECGPYPSKFEWTTFSTNFSTWLLPWLALISQLPFGSQHRQQNVISVFLTLGSPALAAYSLILCVLNWSWVPRAFEGINYPNVNKAWRVLSSLQHSPLHIDQARGLLAGLVVLPENNQWWHAMDEGLNYEDTWTTAIVLQIAWVVVAFVFTIVGSFQDGIADDFQTSGRGTGTLFLWLLPLVIGWQRLSPRCDYVRVRDVLERANAEVYAATPAGLSPTLRSTASSLTSLFSTPRAGNKGSHHLSQVRQQGNGQSLPLKKCINQFPFRLQQCEGDRGASAPIYSYSRLIPWSENVELVAGVFRAAARVAAATDFDALEDQDARRNSLPRVDDLIRHCIRPIDWRAIRRRCIMAGVLAMILSWGAIGSAIVYSFNTPTTGLGCRSGSFLIYASLGTLVWIIMVVSSLLTYYAQEAEREKEGQDSTRASSSSRRRFSPQTLRWLSTMMRHAAKLLATFNAIFIVTMCIFLFSNLFTNCWCDASIISRGVGAFTTIALQPDDESLGQLNVAWGIAIAMSLGSAAIFIAYVYMHVNPADPDPFVLQHPDAVESFAGSPDPFIEHRLTVDVELPTRKANFDPYDTDSTSAALSPDVGRSVYARSPHHRKRSSFSL